MSGRKNLLPPYKIISAGDMSADITGPLTNVSTLDNLGIQLSWSGSPTGNFFIDATLDGGTTWTPLSLSPAPVASGGAGNWYVDLNQIAFSGVRVRYARTSGTGTLTAYISGKQV